MTVDSGLEEPPTVIPLSILNNTVSTMEIFRTAEKIIGVDQDLTPPETGNGQEKPSQALHTLNMTYVNFSPLAGAADHCVPKQAKKADT